MIRKKSVLSRHILQLLLVLAILMPDVRGQYFGKNKVNYETFDFEIYRTPHFQIYNYLDNEEKITDLGQLSERWYERHQAILLDTLKLANPLIIYNNHADFQQTTVISSMIGVGTGGVTEGLRNRVVMPVMKSNAETNHVLGHELVHVFQYHLFKNSDSVNLQNIGSIPLWMIEGLAEYMSIGTVDPHTAMWMRDAILQDDIPTIKDMTRRPDLYFPYRYGHAFWTFVASNWGDAMVKPLLMGSGIAGPERAIDSLMGITSDSLSTLWKEELQRVHGPHIENAADRQIGDKMFGSPQAINISPSISPDGRYVIFLSDRDVIAIDFYLANVKKEKILERLTRDIRDTHIDNYSYLESVGSWSPDSKRYILSMFSQGRKRLMIFNVNDRSPGEIIDVGQVDYFDNPAWSPDGNSILLAGLKNGQSDIYLYNLETEELEQLTDDYYSDMQPTWSPDGSRVAFVSDRGEETEIDRLNYGPSRLCEYDMESGNLTVLPVLPGVDSYSPQYGSDGASIYFISAANGIRNLYEYERGSGTLYRMSDFKTGISGISEQSPALSVARQNDSMVYVLYQNSGYSLYKASSEDFSRERVDPRTTDLAAARLVETEGAYGPTIVQRNLQAYPLGEPFRYEVNPYKPQFKLESIGSVGVGVGISQNTTAAGGGVSFLFSDMLKRNQLFLAARVNGRLIDAGGQLTYIRQKSRLNWGASFTHIPYRTGRSFIQNEVIDSVEVTTLSIVQQRIFEDKISMFGIYPLSKKLRFEAGLSAGTYSFRVDSLNQYYSRQGFYLGRSEQQLPAPETEMLFSGYMAYVGDNAYFGLTSPLRGYRYRLELSRSQGWINYWGVTADYRRYFFLKPVGLAFRAMHYGRYGSDAGDLYPLFLGYPYYVRGYEYNSLTRNQDQTNEHLGINQVMGSKIVVANFEVRLPFTGPKRLALIKLRYVYSDLVAFVDGGMAFEDFSYSSFSLDPSGEEHIPIFSAGASLRINLLGAIIVEPYYAFPLQRNNVGGGQFGFFLSAGGY